LIFSGKVFGTGQIGYDIITPALNHAEQEPRTLLSSSYDFNRRLRNEE
jgi:hypothetical protein